jgi:hypothetical protein
MMKEKLKQESADEETDDGQSTEEGDGQSPAPDEDASDDEELSPEIKPVERKIGEGRDNLRRREEWFQRRTGTGK